MGLFTRIWGESKPSTTDDAQTQDEAFESFRQRHEEANGTSLTNIDAYLETLPPEQRRFARARYEMAKEKPNSTYRGYGSQSYSSYSTRREMDPELKSAIGVGIAAIAIWAISVGITSSNYSTEDAQQYLEEQGYTNVQSEGTDVLFVGLKGCDGADIMKFSFEATAVNNVDVHVMVCKGLFKAATARQG